eukprot:TRINITY_DN91716_c0_g1_i1.p1 TRINITY_DN91716_c0_g1~~TRINITY_DN91716_c0_g1_i1.p1  ORF type:complete len:512 (+),score=49.78 TRINITY_DN91716_c0_g1_i1:82-1617(+)
MAPEAAPKLPTEALQSNQDVSPSASLSPISPIRRRLSRVWLPPPWWQSRETRTCAWGQPSIGWFFLTNFLSWCHMIGPLAYLQHIVQKANPEQGALLWSMSISGRGILGYFASPFLGAISDRFGRKPVLLFNIAVTSLNALPPMLLGSTKLSSYVLLVLTALQGVAGSPFAIPFAYCADTVPPEQSHKLATMNARIVLGMNLAFILAPLGCSALFKLCEDRESLAWQAVMACALFNLLYTSTCLPESLRRSGDNASVSPNRRASAILRTAPEIPRDQLQMNPLVYFRLLSFSGPAGKPAATILRKLCGIIFWLYLAKMNIITCVVLYAEKQFNWPPAKAGSLLSIWGFGQLLCMTFLSMAGSFQNRFLHDERVIIWVGNIGGFAGMLVFFFSTHDWMLTVGMAVGCISMVTLTAATGYAARLVEPTMKGEVQGLSSAVLAITEVIGPIIFGSLLQWAENKHSNVWWLPNISFLIGAAAILVAMFFSVGLPHSTQAARECQEFRSDSAGLVS